MSPEAKTPPPDDPLGEIAKLRALAAGGEIGVFEYEERRRRIVGHGAETEGRERPLLTADGGLIIYRKDQTAKGLIAAVVFLAIGGLFIAFILDTKDTGVRLILALCAAGTLALVAGALRGLIRDRRSDGRALLIDNHGIEYTPARRGRYRISWSQITAAREKDMHTEDTVYKLVELDLRAPLYQFTVEQGRYQDAESQSLSLPTDGLDITRESLLAVIQAHLVNTDREAST